MPTCTPALFIKAVCVCVCVCVCGKCMRKSTLESVYAYSCMCITICERECTFEHVCAY